MADDGTTEFKVYGKRWFMLFVLALLNFSNALLWISFAPIANHTAQFYCSGDCDAADWLSVVFLAMGVPLGFVAMWAMGRFGLRVGVLFGVWADFVGGALRVISALPFVPQGVRLPAALLGQAVAATANPFSMFLPTKLAASWFADDQRAIANTIGSMANPLGILGASLLSPILVKSADDILLMNAAVFLPAVLAVVLATFGVTSSVPPHPPTASAAAADESPAFFAGLKMCITNPSFIVLMVLVGGGIGLFNAIVTLNEQFLCVNGYSNVFAGVTGAIMIVSGLIGSALTGLFVDRTKRFEETAKVCYGGAGLASSAFAVAVFYPNIPVIIAVSIAAFGFFGFGMFPVGLEMGVEVTYPVSEATSTGAIITMGQIEGILFILIMQSLSRDASPQQMNRQVCTTDDDTVPPDWTCQCFLLSKISAWHNDNRKNDGSMIAWNVITVLLVLMGVLLLWPRYKRLEAEAHQAAKEEQSIRF